MSRSVEVDVRAQGLIVLVMATFLQFGTHLAHAFGSWFSWG